MEKNWQTFAEFLTDAPPGTEGLLPTAEIYEPDGFRELRRPELKLYCPGGDCERTLWFTCEDADRFGVRTLYAMYYKCRNCASSTKTYCFELNKRKEVTLARKLGEQPAFGPHTPAKVITLIGPDREFFLKGRRAESQGMGIGAFAYYRRVVENQKGRLFDAIIKIAQEEKAVPEIIAQLENAKKETQFSKAMEVVKPGIPESLKIDGHNPLLLLHSALSQGIHEDADAGCLAIATAIRTVLTELAERMDAVRKGRSEIQQAVAALQKVASKPKAPPTTPVADAT